MFVYRLFIVHTYTQFTHTLNSYICITSYIVYLLWFCVCVGVCVGLVGVCVFSCCWLCWCLAVRLGRRLCGFGLAAFLFFSLVGPFGDPGASPWLVPLGLLPWRLARGFLFLSSLFLSLSLSLSLSLLCTYCKKGDTHIHNSIGIGTHIFPQDLY